MRPHATGRCATADRHSPGRRAGRRGGHPPVSACARGRRARDRRRRHRLRGHAVRVPRSARLAARRRARRHRRGRSRSAAASPSACSTRRSPGSASGSARCMCAGALADHGYVWWPGLLGGALCAALAGAATQSLVMRTRARLDAEARAALPVYLEGAGVRARRAGRRRRARHGRSRSASSRSSCAARAAARARSTRACASSGDGEQPPKLVLTVIDGMKPTMLQRAIGAGTAPALKAIRDRGTYVDDCCAAFPSVTPVCAGVIATGRMQDEHRVPSMNWYSREEERYVEYGSSFSASRKFGLNRQLVDTIFNMNSQHLAADVPTIFETLDDAGVRTACTSYLIFRGRHAHEVSRDWALTRVASQLFKRSVMGPGRALLRRHLREPQDGLLVADGDPRDARPARRLRRLLPRRARPLRLPAAVAARQRRALAQVRPARADRVDRGGRRRAVARHGGRRRRRDVPRRARDDRHGRPLAFAHRAGRRRSPEAFADWKVLRPVGHERGRGRDRAVPGAALGDGLPPAPVARRRARAGRRRRRARSRASTSSCGARAGARAIAGERGELSFAPGDQVVDDRGLRWDVDGELDDAARHDRGRHASSASTTRTRCGACGRR